MSPSYGSTVNCSQCVPQHGKEIDAVTFQRSDVVERKPQMGDFFTFIHIHQDGIGATHSNLILTGQASLVF